MTDVGSDLVHYDQLISFGWCCETTAQIRRYTGTESPGLFDWALSGWEDLTRCINSNFSDFFKLANLKPTEDGEAVRDTATGLEFAHLFGTPGNRRVHRDIIEREFPRHEQNLRFMLRDLNETLDEWRVLIVRQGNPTAEEALALWSAVIGAHPGGRFDMLIVNTGRLVTHLDHPRIRVGLVQVPVPGPNAWRGDNVTWDEVFERHAPLNRFVAQKDSRRTQLDAHDASLGVTVG